MPYTFGGATGDDGFVAGDITAGADNCHGLIIGWFFPTTLTAGRTYWGYGTTGAVPPKALVATTTSEIVMYSNNTTDGVWTTSGAGIATERWWCIAWAYSFETTGNLGTYRVWVGNESSPPQEVTVTVTTPLSGAFTGQSRVVWGNSGSSGTTAFQGVIGPFTNIAHTNVSIGSTTGIAASGAISQDEADNILRRQILPWWRGDIGPNACTFNGANSMWVHWDSYGTRVQVKSRNSAVGLDRTATIAGATLSQARSPTNPRTAWLGMGSLARAGRL